MRVDKAFLKKHTVTLLLCCILLAAFGVRIQGIGFGLPSIYAMNDEVPIVEYALRMGMGDLNPHFFLWPANSEMYLLLFLYGIYFVVGKVFGLFASVSDFALSYWIDASPFYLIGRYVSALLGTATVGLAYLIGKKHWNSQIGLIGALFLAFTFEHVRFSHNLKVDIMAAFLAFLALYFAMNILKHPRFWDYALAGVFTGLAIASKYIAGLAAIPLFLAHVFVTNEQAKPWHAMLFDKKLFGSGVAVVVGLFVGSPYIFLSSHESWKWFTRMLKYGSKGVLIGDYYGNRLQYMFTDVLRHAFGIGLLIVVLCGVGYAIVKHTKPLVVLLSFPLLYILSLLRMQMLLLRHINLALPFLALLGAVGFYAIIEKFFQQARYKYLYMGVAAILLLILPIYDIFEYNILVYSRKDSGKLAQEWIEQHIPAGSKIAREVYWLAPPLAQNKTSLNRMYQAISQDRPGQGTRYKTRLEIPDEYFPAITYDLVDIFSITEFVHQSPGKYFRANSFDYAVLSSEFYHRFHKEGALEHHPEDVHEAFEFYDLLEERGELIQVFQPDDYLQKKYGSRGYIEFPPVIKIYKLDSAKEL